jgi:hypothetical protein
MAPILGLLELFVYKAKIKQPKRTLIATFLFLPY